MQVKIFKITDVKAGEEEMNAWFAEHPEGTARIHHIIPGGLSTKKKHASGIAGNVEIEHALTLSVFYSTVTPLRSKDEPT